MLITTAVLLAGYIAACFWLSYGPSRPTDPQRGMAIGLMMFVAIILAVGELILAGAALIHWRWLIIAMFILVMVPTLLIIPQLLRVQYKEKMRTIAKYHDTETQIIGIELKQLIEDKTHAISVTLPTRTFTTLRYYGLEGTLIPFEEEGGHIKRIHLTGHWHIENNFLISQGNHSLFRHARYQFWRTADGELRAYLGRGWWRKHPVVFMKVNEVRPGKPMVTSGQNE